MNGIDTSNLKIEPYNEIKPEETIPEMAKPKKVISEIAKPKEKIPELNIHQEKIIENNSKNTPMETRDEIYDDPTDEELKATYHKYNGEEPISDIYNKNSPFDYNDGKKGNIFNVGYEAETVIEQKKMNDVNKVSPTKDVYGRNYILDVDDTPDRKEISSSVDGNQAIEFKRKYAKKGRVILDFSQGNENAKIIVSLNSGPEAITPITEKRQKIGDKETNEITYIRKHSIPLTKEDDQRNMILNRKRRSANASRQPTNILVYEGTSEQEKEKGIFSVFC